MNKNENMIWNCDLCDATDVRVRHDDDLNMWLCDTDFDAFNGEFVSIELDEVF